MKQITDYTEKEILTLKDEQLEAMVKLEMAEQGIKILSFPKEPEYTPLPPKTEEVFSLTGFTYQLLDRTKAEKLSKAINELSEHFVNTDYKYPTYNVKWLKTLDNYTKGALGEIKSEFVYKKEDTDRIAELNSKNEALKAEYEELLKEYNGAKEASTEIRESIFGAYYAVQQKYCDYNVMADRYSDYLSIADGDKDIAMKFLKKAYNVSDDTEDYIIFRLKEKAVKPPVKVKVQPIENDDLAF